MIKTIDDIKITHENGIVTILNTKSNAFVSIYKEVENIIYRDSFGNVMQSGFCKLTINDNLIFELTHLGQTIRFKDGTLVGLLSKIDVQELAEKTFYEESQTRVYDFINLKFNIEI